MPFDLAHEFADYLRDRNHLAGDSNLLNGTAPSQDERTLHKLWGLTDLSAADFADEVAVFFKVPRIGLPDLLSAPPLADRFSRRFLREMLVFPFQSADGEPMLAVADPSNSAAVRAAGIVLGGDINIQVASFEDIETALDQRLGNDAAAPEADNDAAYAREDDIESLRDLAADPRFDALGFKAGETIYEPKGCERCGGTGYRTG